ncbi:MAG TPA: EamA family transporter RarD [Candidatus Nanopelagicales bacterium]
MTAPPAAPTGPGPEPARPTRPSAGPVPTASSLRSGLLAGVTAYVLWGFFPLYFPLLEPASALEILAHRIVWSLVVSVLLVMATRGWAKVRAVLANRRQLGLLVAASVLISVNWGTYIWAVNSNQVVETALGYFINPLISVLMGVVLLRERMRPWQWAAFGVATLAVVVLTAAYGRLPWIALVLAFSFGTYGLCKKLAGVESVPSLAVETAVTFPLALGFLIYLQVQGTLVFGHSSLANTLLLFGCGIITVGPLLAFNAAATRIPLSVLGLLQYLTPILQFILGITVFAEHMPAERWVGFGIVWVALAIFTIDGIRNSPRSAG